MHMQSIAYTDKNERLIAIHQLDTDLIDADVDLDFIYDCLIHNSPDGVYYSWLLDEAGQDVAVDVSFENYEQLDQVLNLIISLYDLGYRVRLDLVSIVLNREQEVAEFFNFCTQGHNILNYSALLADAFPEDKFEYIFSDERLKAINPNQTNINLLIS